MNWNISPSPVSLSGTVWEDHNGNGVRDTGDQGLAGWHILVNGVDRATTDANGNWSVANLAAGTYTVQASRAERLERHLQRDQLHRQRRQRNATSGSLNFGEFKLVSLSGNRLGRSQWQRRTGHGR